MAPNPLAPAWLTEPADVNELAPRVWPQTAQRGADGVVAIGGVSLAELAAEYGTPLYVLDEADVRSRATRARLAFDAAFERIGTEATVYYAGKAFLSTEVARWMTADGLNIDVCSGGELEVVLAAGVAPARLGFHGNNKSLAEIERAVAVGIGTIVIDSEAEIGRVADAARRHGRVQRVRLRVSSGVHAHTHEFLATAHEDQKFGCPLDAADRYVAQIRAHESLEFVGLHCHIGSQIFDASGFEESAARLIEVHARLSRTQPVPELNLGGGFGIAYTAADDPRPIEEIADRIASVVAANCERLRVPVPHMAFEPGRALIGPGGVTLYTVGTIKPVAVQATQPVASAPEDAREDAAGETARGETATRLYVSIDGGMSDNARTALYGADYTTRLVGRSSAAEPALVRLAGKHCESGDIVVDADYLPADITPGDLVAVAATGAYCWSLSSNYNYLPRPAVVAVSDGAARVIVRGESVSDLLARDAFIRREAREEEARP